MPTVEDVRMVVISDTHQHPNPKNPDADSGMWGNTKKDGMRENR